MDKALIILAYAITGICVGQQIDPGGATIRLDVNLILAHAVVFDKSGQAISDLDKQAFRLWVDGVQQTITVFQKDDAPVTVGILVDNSASMTSKGSEVLAAARSFAQASNPQDQMFVVHFSDKAVLGLPAETPFTGNFSKLDDALSRFNAAGTTALYDALTLAFSQLHKATIERRVLFVISDGGDNSSQKHLEDVLKLAREFGYVIYTVGIYDSTSGDSNPQVLRQLANLTGGKAYLPQDLTDVKRIAVEIAQEIRKQYTLGFQGHEDGQYHHITVSVQDQDHGKLDVRTRAGYFGPTRPGSGNQGQ
jgi:VWFA-related protein